MHTYNLHLCTEMLIVLYLLFVIPTEANNNNQWNQYYKQLKSHNREIHHSFLVTILNSVHSVPLISFRYYFLYDFHAKVRGQIQHQTEWSFVAGALPLRQRALDRSRSPLGLLRLSLWSFFFSTVRDCPFCYKKEKPLNCKNWHFMYTFTSLTKGVSRISSWTLKVKCFAKWGKSI